MCDLRKISDRMGPLFQEKKKKIMNFSSLMGFDDSLSPSRQAFPSSKKFEKKLGFISTPKGTMRGNIRVSNFEKGLNKYPYQHTWKKLII